MPVPYGRKSRSKSRMQRRANMKMQAVQFVYCPVCGDGKLYHNICERCHIYKRKISK